MVSAMFGTLWPFYDAAISLSTFYVGSMKTFGKSFYFFVTTKNTVQRSCFYLHVQGTYTQDGRKKEVNVF